MSINHSFIFSTRVLVLCLLPEVQRHGVWSCPRDIKYLSTCPFRTFIFDISIRDILSCIVHFLMLFFRFQNANRQLCLWTFNFQWHRFSWQMLPSEIGAYSSRHILVHNYLFGHELSLLLFQLGCPLSAPWVSIISRILLHGSQEEVLEKMHQVQRASITLEFVL